MYKWSVKEIDYLFNFYYKKALDEEDNYRRSMYVETCNCLEELINYYEEVLNSSGYCDDRSSMTYKNVIKDDLRLLHSYGVYAPIARNFVNQFEGRTFISQPCLPKVTTSANGILSMTNSFYKQFKGIFYEKYLELESNFRTRLHFKKISGQYNMGGNTHAIKNTDIIYIDVGKSNTFQDYISHIHESSHGITSLINRDIMWDFNKYALIEVDAIFFELLGLDFVGNSLNNEEDSLIVKRASFIDYLCSAELICSKMDLYNDVSQDNLGNVKLIKAYYKNKCKYNKQMIKEALFTTIGSIFHYVISYLIAIELYYIYMSDQEYALDLLYKIITAKNLGIVDYLELIDNIGIIPGQHIEEYCDSIFGKKDMMVYGKKM